MSFLLCAFGLYSLRLCEKKHFTQRRKAKTEGAKESKGAKESVGQ
jgi:hypothetical protein